MPTLPELLDQVSALLGRRDLSQNEYAAWLGGTINGGPSGNGTYPLSDSTGFVRMVACPAKLYDMVDGKYAPMFADAAATQAQMKAWLGGTVNGGTFGTGLYPVTLSTGATIYAPSPARLQADRDTIAEIIGSAGTITLTEGRVYDTAAELVPADDGKWALVHSDPDLEKNGYYLRVAGDWELKISLASQALLIALGEQLQGLVPSQIIGRPVDPDLLGTGVGSTDMLVWNDPVTEDGFLTGIRIYALATGDLRLSRYSKSGTTITKLASIVIPVSTLGMQTITVDFEVGANDYLGLAGTGIFTSTNATADGGGWWNVHPDPDTRTVGTPITNIRLEVQFQLATMQQTVNAGAFAALTTQAADALARMAVVEGETALLHGSDLQTIGRVSDPSNGTVVTNSDMFILAVPNTTAGALQQVKLYAEAAGTIQLAAYSKSGTTVTRRVLRSVVLASAGPKVLTPADFGGEFPVAAGEYLAFAGENVISFTGSTTDQTPWWSVLSSLPVRTVGATNSANRMEVSFKVDQPYQVVTAAAFEDLEDRIEVAEGFADKIALLDGEGTQVIGRTSDPIAGAPVSNSMFVWATPIENDGTLTQVKVMVSGAGTLRLVRWSLSGSTLTREDVREIAIASAGLKTLLPADFGGPMAIQAGEYLGLSGAGTAGMFYSTGSAPVDGPGWWGVVDGLDTRPTGTLFTTNRLEASFEVFATYQVVTAEAVQDLDERVTELETADISISAGSLIAVPAMPSMALHEAPLIGGRTGQRMVRINGRRTLAMFDKVASMQGATGLSDVATADTLFGASAVQLATPTTDTDVYLAPAAAGLPVNVTWGMIRFWHKSVANVHANIARISIELHSAGSPSAPTGNYHRLVPTVAPFDFKARLTSRNGIGLWQSWGVPVAQFSAVGSGADLSAVTFARVVFRSTSGTTFTIQPGMVEFVPNPLPKAKMIVSFDNHYAGHATFSAVEMARHAFPGVLFPSEIPSTVDINPAFMTSQQIRNLHDNHGWQIGCQAWSTELASIVDAWSESEFTAELQRIRAWQNAMGLSGGDHGSFFSDVTFQDLVAYPSFRKHFRSMRMFIFANAAGDPLTYGEMFPFGDPMRVRALALPSITDSTNGARMIAHAQQAVANRGVAYFALHDEQDTPGHIQDGYVQLLAWANENRDVIDVTTEEDLYSYL